MTATDDFAFDELDELASAYLDGEVTDAEVERVEADPDLMARVERLRIVAEAVAGPVALASPLTRHSAVQAAMSAAKSGAAATTAAAPSSVTAGADTTPPTRLDDKRSDERPEAPVTSLDAARERKGLFSPERIRSIAAVAAVVAVGLLAVGVLSQVRLGDRSNEVTATASNASTDTVDAASEAANDAASDTADAASESIGSIGDAAGDALDDAGDAMADDAMVEEEAMDEEEAMEDEAPEDEAMEDEAMEESDEASAFASDADAGADDSTGTADNATGEATSDAEARLAQADYRARPDFLGDFDTIDDLVASGGARTAASAPQLVLPEGFADCDLSTVGGPERALLYIGTAVIADEALILLTEPTDGPDDPILTVGYVNGVCELMDERLLGG